MTVIRARQGVLTRAHPHNANRTHLIPGGTRQWRNRLLNSRWAGLGGDYSVGNFVGPDSWGLGFWPPKDAEAWPNDEWNACHFFGGSGGEGRGYIGQMMQLQAGMIFTMSCYVDQVGVAPVDSHIFWPAQQSGNPGTVNMLRAPIKPGVGFTGRVDGEWEVTNSGRFEMRFGMGTNQAEPTATPDFVLSRPQVTIGKTLWPWQGSGLNPGPWDETVQMLVGNSGSGFGYSFANYGSLTPNEVYTHQVFDLNTNNTNKQLYLRWRDNKNYGIQRVQLNYQGGIANLDWNDIDRFVGSSAIISDAWAANVGNTVPVRLTLKRWVYGDEIL